MTRFLRSGKTVSRFCAAEGVTVACFYQWRRRLSDTTAGLGNTRQPTAPPASTGKTEFWPVRIADSSLVEIELPNGVQVRVPACAAAALHAAILAAGKVGVVAGPEVERC